jgi:hypothetical protein
MNLKEIDYEALEDSVLCCYEDGNEPSGFIKYG